MRALLPTAKHRLQRKEDSYPFLWTGTASFLAMIDNEKTENALIEKQKLESEKVNRKIQELHTAHSHSENIRPKMQHHN